jgi:ABC-type glycerol-3-phosphate transport system substrate-binding protein
MGLPYDCEIALNPFTADTPSAKKERSKMKTGSFKLIAAVGMILGILAATPAQAGNGTIKITHASTPYVTANQTASNEVKANAKANQAKTPEVQVAVLANGPTQPGARRSIFIHR